MCPMDTDLEQYEMPPIYVTDPGYDDMGSFSTNWASSTDRFRMWIYSHSVTPS